MSKRCTDPILIYFSYLYLTYDMFLCYAYALIYILFPCMYECA